MSLVQLDIFTDQDLEILMLYYSQCALCTMHSVFEIVESWVEKKITCIKKMQCYGKMQAKSHAFIIYLEYLVVDFAFFIYLWKKRQQINFFHQLFCEKRNCLLYLCRTYYSNLKWPPVQRCKCTFFLLKLFIDYPSRV